MKTTECGYRDASTDVWGRLEGPGHVHTLLDVMVSRKALPRALQLYALIIGALKRGSVSLVTQKGRTLACVGSDEVRLRIKEQVQAQSGLPLIERKYASSWDAPRQQKMVGTGRLQLLVSVPDRYGFSTYEVQFRDGRVPLEGQLELILTYLRGIPQRAAERREVQREEEVRRQAELHRQTEERSRVNALRAERERRQREEVACREGLHTLARVWEDTERLRAYLNAFDQGTISTGTAGEINYSVWRAWAAQQVVDSPKLQGAMLQHWVLRVTEMARWEPLDPLSDGALDAQHS